jgi:hypothetical protein
LSDSENEKMYHNTDEFQSFRNEALIPTNRIQALLGCVGITVAPMFRIKRVLRSGWENFWAIMEIFQGSNVVSRHTRPAFRAPPRTVLSTAKLKNSVYYILPQRKKTNSRLLG